MEVLLKKTADGALVPVDEGNADLLKKIKLDATLRCEIKRVRNPKFLRKFFKLLSLGYEAWEPGIAEYKGFEVQKDFEQFRETVTIAAGHFYVTTNLNGAVRVRAKSIAFDSMEEEEFESLYTSVANVLLERVLTRYTRADLDAVVDRILGF
jgi:hypothetical protein